MHIYNKITVHEVVEEIFLLDPLVHARATRQEFQA